MLVTARPFSCESSKTQGDRFQTGRYNLKMAKTAAVWKVGSAFNALFLFDPPTVHDNDGLWLLFSASNLPCARSRATKTRPEVGSLEVTRGAVHASHWSSDVVMIDVPFWPDMIAWSSNRGESVCLGNGRLS